MVQKAQFILLAFWTVIGLPEPSWSCQSSPSCMEAFNKQDKLQDAIKNEDTEAVCKYLPARIHCLQLAVNACSNQDISQRKDKPQKVVLLVKEMEERFRDMCPDYSLNPPNSSPGSLRYTPQCLLTSLFVAVTSVIVSSRYVELWCSLIYHGS